MKDTEREDKWKCAPVRYPFRFERYHSLFHPTQWLRGLPKVVPKKLPTIYVRKGKERELWKNLPSHGNAVVRENNFMPLVYDPFFATSNFATKNRDAVGIKWTWKNKVSVRECLLPFVPYTQKDKVEPDVQPDKDDGKSMRSGRAGRFGGNCWNVEDYGA